MTVTKEWLDELAAAARRSESAALAKVRLKAAELYRAKHGRGPETSAERSEGLRLLQAAADAVKGNASGGNGHVPGGRFMTLAERRRIDHELDAVLERGW